MPAPALRPESSAHLPKTGTPPAASGSTAFSAPVPEWLAEAVELIASGVSQRQAAEQLGVHKASIWTWLDRIRRGEVAGFGAVNACALMDEDDRQAMMRRGIRAERTRLVQWQRVARLGDLLARRVPDPAMLAKLRGDC